MCMERPATCPRCSSHSSKSLKLNLGPFPEDPRLPFIRVVLQALDDSRADRYWMDTLFTHISNNPDRDHIVFGELCGEGRPVPSFRIANEVMCLDPISQAIGIPPAERSDRSNAQCRMHNARSVRESPARVTGSYSGIATPFTAWSKPTRSREGKPVETGCIEILQRCPRAEARGYAGNTRVPIYRQHVCQRSTGPSHASRMPFIPCIIRNFGARAR